jgi:hypothetical protein
MAGKRLENGLQKPGNDARFNEVVVRQSRSFLAGVIALAGVCHEATAAGPVTFTVDSTRSSVSLSGFLTVPLAGEYPYQTQGAGSLTTSLGGGVIVELAPPGILFPGGSDVFMETNGTWAPAVGGGAGSAPANYAGKINPPSTTNEFAGRNIHFDVIGSATLNANGLFDANLIVTYLTNASPAPSVDYHVTSSLPGVSTNGTALLTAPSTNAATGATLSSGSGTLTLVVPVNDTNVLTIGSYPSTTILSGQIVATAPARDWPLVISVSRESGILNLSWSSLPGQSFTVETTPNLGEPWSSASGTTNVTGTTTIWTPASTPDTAQFYRVVGSY